MIRDFLNDSDMNWQKVKMSRDLCGVTISHDMNTRASKKPKNSTNTNIIQFISHSLSCMVLHHSYWSATSILLQSQALAVLSKG